MKREFVVIVINYLFYIYCIKFVKGIDWGIEPIVQRETVTNDKPINSSLPSGSNQIIRAKLHKSRKSKGLVTNCMGNKTFGKRLTTPWTKTKA